MLKKIIFTVIVPLNIYAQKNIVVTDNERNILPFVSIKPLGTNEGFYTDEKGIFSLSDIKSDSIEISCLGYKSQKIRTKEIKDTVDLKQKTEFLSEVNISIGKPSKKVIGFVNKKKSLSWHIRPKTELVTLVKSKNSYDKAIIDKIFIPIGKKQIKLINNNYQEIYPDFNTFFRIKLYSNLNNKPHKLLLQKPILVNCTQNTNDIIEIDVSKNYLEYSNDGVFIGVEMIGDQHTSNAKKSLLPSFEFTQKTKKNIYSKSYIKNIFLGDDWVDIETNNHFSKVKKFNMAISLSLDVYNK